MRQTGSGNVQCYVTDCTVLVTEVDEKVLVPDHHLIGYLASSQVNQCSKEEKSDNEVQFVHSTNANFNSMTCFMCSNISQVTCTSCPMSFCSGECFKQLHSTPALASHEFKHNDLSQVCKEHGREIVFLAVEDLQLGCPECFSLGELDHGCTKFTVPRIFSTFYCIFELLGTSTTRYHQKTDQKP